MRSTSVFSAAPPARPPWSSGAGVGASRRRRRTGRCGPPLSRWARRNAGQRTGRSRSRPGLRKREAPELPQVVLHGRFPWWPMRKEAFRERRGGALRPAFLIRLASSRMTTFPLGAGRGAFPRRGAGRSSSPPRRRGEFRHETLPVVPTEIVHAQGGGETCGLAHPVGRHGVGASTRERP